MQATIISDLLKYCVTKYGNDDFAAIYSHDSGIKDEITYSEFAESVNQLKNCFPQCGGKHIVIYMDSNHKWLQIFFAVVVSGNVAILVDANRDPNDLLKQIQVTDPDTIITDDLRLDKLKVIFSNSNSLKIVTVPDLLKSEPENLTFKNPDPDSIAVVTYTSGSTGNPKGVVFTQQEICAAVWSQYNSVYFPEKLRALIILPLWHVFGLVTNTLFLMYIGGRVFFLSSLQPKDIFSSFSKCKINALAATPIFFESIYRKINFKIEDMPWHKKIIFKMAHKFFKIKFLYPITKHFSRIVFKKLHDSISPSLTYFISGGAQLNPHIISSLFGFGYVMMNGYGMSEMCGSVAFSGEYNYSCGSVGKPNIGVQVKINNPDKHGHGEILVSGAQQMEGYLNQEELTATVINDGWFSTGDVGYLDKRNYLHISGRIKDVIITSSGENVYPEDIESHFSDIYPLQEVCVFSQVLKSGGEKIEIIIRLPREVTLDQDIDKIFEKIKKRNHEIVFSHRVQDFYITHEEFPRTVTKKIDRKKIKADFLLKCRKYM